MAWTKERLQEVAQTRLAGARFVVAARTLHRALTMPEVEQERRMWRLRRQVAEHNVYRHAASARATLLEARRP